MNNSNEICNKLLELNDNFIQKQTILDIKQLENKIRFYESKIYFLKQESPLTQKKKIEKNKKIREYEKIIDDSQIKLLNLSKIFEK